MTKTLWCEKERENMMDMPSYYKVTATKVEEVVAGEINLYRDADGNEYMVHRNTFKRRDEFYKVN